MIIGIKLTPQPGKPEAVHVFYAGHDASELSKRHLELLAKNTDKSRFVMLRNPSSIPLASVVTSTEEHPDNVAAREKRETLAKATIAKAAAPVTSPAQQPALPGAPLPPAGESDDQAGTREALQKMEHAELLKLATELVTAGRLEALPNGPKSKLIEAILAAPPAKPASGA